MPSPPDLAIEGDVLRLPAHGVTTTAEDIRAHLVLMAEMSEATVVDASKVESIGQAVLQLLIAARAEAERDGKAFSIVNPSKAFSARVLDCQLGEVIGLGIQKEETL